MIGKSMFFTAMHGRNIEIAPCAMRARKEKDLKSSMKKKKRSTGISKCSEMQMHTQKYNVDRSRCKCSAIKHRLRRKLRKYLKIIQSGK